MRVHEPKPRVEKKVLPPAVVHKGEVEDYKIISFETKNGPGYALKLLIKPADSSYFKVTAFDWVGYDEDGPYILKGSKMNTWLCRIFKVDDLAKIILEQVKKKEVYFEVKNELRKWTNKEGQPVERIMADVIDVHPAPASSTPAAQTPATPAAPPTPAKPAPAPAAASPAPAPSSKKSDGWDDEETL